MKKTKFLNLYSHYYYEEEITLISKLFDVLDIYKISFNDNFIINLVKDIISRYRKEKYNPDDVYHTYKYSGFNTFETAGWFMPNIYNELINVLDEKTSAEISIDLAYKIIEEPFVYTGKNKDDIEYFTPVNIRQTLNGDKYLTDNFLQNMISLMTTNTNYSKYADNLYILYFEARKKASINSALDRGYLDKRNKIVMSKKK